PPCGPPYPGVLVPGLLEPAGEDVRGSGDGQGSSGGHRADAAADANVLPYLRPVVSGRLAGEIVLIPTAYRHASWSCGDHADTAVATWQFGDDTEAAELLLEPNGRLAEVRISRWGNPEGAPFRRHPFAVRFEAESRFGGITIPSVFRAAWHESEFFRAEITGAVFS
ncbi:MAG: DUF6544 family protein, partial [Streptosporangiaceae bacterium]